MRHRTQQLPDRPPHQGTTRGNQKRGNAGHTSGTTNAHPPDRSPPIVKGPESSTHEQCLADRGSGSPIRSVNGSDERGVCRPKGRLAGYVSINTFWSCSRVSPCVLLTATLNPTKARFHSTGKNDAHLGMQSDLDVRAAAIEGDMLVSLRDGGHLALSCHEGWQGISRVLVCGSLFCICNVGEGSVEGPLGARVNVN